jgi:hypothetical protein
MCMNLDALADFINPIYQKYRLASAFDYFAKIFPIYLK